MSFSLLSTNCVNPVYHPVFFLMRYEGYPKNMRAGTLPAGMNTIWKIHVTWGWRLSAADEPELITPIPMIMPPLSRLDRPEPTLYFAVTTAVKYENQRYHPCACLF